MSGPDTGFRRPVADYPDDSGVSLRLMMMPVARPAPPPQIRPRRRRSPGDPSCQDCRETTGGACPDHRDYHAEIDPLDGLPGIRPRGPLAPDDLVRDWRPV